MQKLEPHNQIPVSAGSLGAFLNQYGIKDFTFRDISESGIENSSFVIESDGKKYVLRVYKQGKKSDEDISFEIRFQDYLRTHGIPAPVIYPTTAGEGLAIAHIAERRWQAILMQFVEGQSGISHPSSALIADLARLQAKMHLLGSEFAQSTEEHARSWADLHDSLAQKLKPAPDESREIVDFLERVASYNYPLSPELPYGYNHLDIDFGGNVIISGDKVAAIVDFDDLQYSPPVVCLGYTLWSVLSDGGEAAMRHYVQEYEKVRSLTPLERKTLPHVIFFRNYVIGVLRLLLRDKTASSIAEIEGILRLEQEIPALAF